MPRVLQGPGVQAQEEGIALETAIWVKPAELCSERPGRPYPQLLSQSREEATLQEWKDSAGHQLACPK